MTSSLRCYGCGEPDGSCGCSRKWAIFTDDRTILPQHRKWLTAQLLSMTSGVDYADNIRIARVGDRDAEAQYARQFEKGCCGFSDTYVKHSDGTVYAVGFNYGH